MGPQRAVEQAHGLRMERPELRLMPTAFHVGRTGLLWEATLVGALFALAFFAAVVTHWLAMPEMRTGPLTDTGTLSVHAGHGTTLGFFLLTWTIMMAAMMFPAVAPVVVSFHRWVRRTGRSRLETPFFLAGYLLVWTAAGLIGYAAVVTLGSLMPPGRVAKQFGGLVLVLTGAYQFSAVKDACLRQCRSPLGTLAERFDDLRRGGLAGTWAGAANGSACLGCCWLFMVVLLLLGMMSLAWMAAVGGIIFLEKVLPTHWPVRESTGLSLMVAGVVVAATHTAWAIVA